MPKRAAATTAPSPEDHVRRYLQFLTDPESLRDEAAIKRAYGEVAQATDPISKVRALSALERAEAIDGEVYRVEFVAHAAGWVESADVSVSALANFGVPEEDLVEAGLVTAARVRQKAKAPVKGRRSPRMDPADVAARMRKGEEYLLADIAALINREPPTTRNYVNRLLAEGVVEDLGDDPNHDGKGKPAHVYRLAEG